MTRPPAAPVGPEDHANHPASGAAAGERAGAVPPRRRWLYGAAAAVVAAGGAGWAALAWRQGQTSAAAVPAGLWQQSFPTPEGGVLDLQALRGQPLVLNFWATWCPPCVAELPLLSSFSRENAANGWQVLGIAVDQAAAVRTFLDRVPVAFPVALAPQGGIALSRSLGNLAGGLPFTVVFGADGQVRHRKMGQITPQNLQDWMALR
ncbi:TlpA family protein disulfide reductase [Simplicispira metamorpha]|uniref:Thiol-disulfide isomerase/thioredoxin n=1 Tax=Simplicispira metamorpha TaxID=80881 RepID=A0A4R2N989_9BURK|nr:TlpA disulfide reductase family protein [Simplicispira metamorpha]TCP17508.1 thiol-disulfide isomerase/thioredoxin [Simplicispira metamorpha]